MAIRAAIFGVVVLVTGLASAQAPESVAFSPAWERVPQAGDYERHYPREAVQRNVSGVAVLCCWARADRSLQCDNGAEWPQGHHFLAAASEMSTAFSLSADSYAAYRAAGTYQFAVTMPFRMGQSSDEFNARISAIATRVRAVCAQATPPAGDDGGFEPELDFSLRSDWRRTYPQRALDRTQEGRADLCCHANAEGVLDCDVTTEAPENGGFGASAQSMIEAARLSPGSLRQVSAMPRSEFGVRVVYALDPRRRTGNIDIQSAPASCPASAITPD